MNRMRSVAGWAFAAILWAAAGAEAGGAGAADALDKSYSSLRRFVLDNGTVCLVGEDHSAPVVAVQIWVRTGAIHEQEHLGGGLSHYVEHMIFKGTERRGMNEVARDIDNAGGSINAYTASDRTVIHADLPSASWKVGLDVLSDAVMNSVFPEEEWAKEKEVILREFAMGRDNPDRVLSLLFWSTAYTEHPYRVPVIGYEEVFRKMTRAELRGYFASRYTPDRTIAVVVGDVDGGSVEAEMRRIFGGRARQPGAPVVLPVEPPQVSPRFERRSGKYNVSRMTIGYHTVALTDADAPVLDVLAVMAGQGDSSRLALRVRDRRKLVHAIGAWSYTPQYPGMFGINAEFEPENEEAVVAEIRAEVASWGAGKFGRDEVGKAVKKLLASELGALETMSGRAGSYASGEFYAFDPKFSLAYLRAIEKVTPESVRAAARKYLLPAGETIAILCPEGKRADDEGVRAAPAIPAARKMTLSGGIPLIVREDRRLPFVYWCVSVGGGLLTETPSTLGVARLTANMMTRGAGGLNAERIAETYESMGAALAPFSGRNSFGLRGKCLSSDAEAFGKLFARCLLEPSFDAGEVEQQKEIQMAGIRQQREQPMFLAQDALAEAIYGEHPYRWTELGTDDTVSRLNRDDLRRYHAAHVVCGNMALAIFGDIGPDEAKNLAERCFSGVPPGKAPGMTAVAKGGSLPARVEQRAPRNQTILLVGFPGVCVSDPRADALDVLDTAMSGLTSDIAMEVREKRGMAYYVGAFQRLGVAPGMFAFYVGTTEEQVGEVEKLIMAQVARLVSDGPRDQEVQRAGKQIIARGDMSLQDNFSLAMECSLNELYGLGYDYGFKLKERISAVGAENIKAAAASLFNTNSMAVSIVLPARAPGQVEEKGNR